jgi:malate-CoA ligase subunit beta
VDVHEYQAKELLASFGVPVPGRGRLQPGPGRLCRHRAWRLELGVKAQIHAGARGKAGGIKLCKTYHEVRDAAANLLGKRLVTIQTGPEGKPVQRVYMEVAEPFDRELYLGYVLDRKAERIRVIASTRGGMEIEEIAKNEPEAILQVDGRAGRRLAGLPGPRARLPARPQSSSRSQSCVSTIMNAYRAFRDCDATMLEINPLVVSKDDRVLALDAKMSFDDNALFRRHNIADMHDPSQQDPREAQAAEHNLNYIGLDGEIGCIVNGAGLAMATMDMIKHAGGTPANFLDVGGGASPERIATALQARAVRLEGEGRAGEHLRRHQSLRLGRQGRGPGLRDGRRQGAAGGAPCRHQCRRGAENSRGKRAEADHRRDAGRSRGEGRGGLPGPACGLRTDQE